LVRVASKGLYYYCIAAPTNILIALDPPKVLITRLVQEYTSFQLLQDFRKKVQTNFLKGPRSAVSLNLFPRASLRFLHSHRSDHVQQAKQLWTVTRVARHCIALLVALAMR
jgi:hypothetical protein